MLSLSLYGRAGVVVKISKRSTGAQTPQRIENLDVERVATPTGAVGPLQQRRVREGQLALPDMVQAGRNSKQFAKTATGVSRRR